MIYSLTMADRPISDEEYEGSRAFLGYFVENVWKLPISPENHPLTALDRMSSSLTKSKIRQALRMAIDDCLEASADFTTQQIKEIDAGLTAAGAPTLSLMRKRFWRRIASALKRGRIRSESEYYAIRGAAEIADDPREKEHMWALVEEFESRPKRRSTRHS